MRYVAGKWVRKKDVIAAIKKTLESKEQEEERGERKSSLLETHTSESLSTIGTTSISN